MNISASVRSAATHHDVDVSTDATRQALSMPATSAAGGSAVNGGEFLMLALATCYCNDLYREAERLGIPLDAVEVEATASFPGTGLAATNIRYRASVTSVAPAATIAELLRQTDAVAKVHNTLRAGASVTLVG
jgi:organic hydroperoxide reductase OsmC/OhrA